MQEGKEAALSPIEGFWLVIHALSLACPWSVLQKKPISPGDIRGTDGTWEDGNMNSCSAASSLSQTDWALAIW